MSATQTPHAGPASDRSVAGFITIQYVWAVALSMTFLLLLVNLVVFQYGRGVVRTALDEGVRAGSRAPAAADACRTRVTEVLDQLLGGPLGDGVSVDCRDLGERVEADANVVFEPWLDVMPSWTFRLRASAIREART